VFRYFSIHINPHKFSFLLLSFFAVVIIYGGSNTGYSHALETQKTFRLMNSDSLMTIYPFWHVYGQPPYQTTPVNKDINTKTTGSSFFQEDNSFIDNNTKADQQQIVLNNLQDIETDLNQFLTIYSENGNSSEVSLAESIYSKTYDKVITPLRTINPDKSLYLNTKFDELINSIELQKPDNEIALKVEEIKNLLDEFKFTESKNNSSIAPTIAFTSSFSIIFREGLEAALILGAIVTYLEASRNEKFIKYIHVGMILAIGISLFVWLLLDYMLQSSGIDKDLLKGIVGISAVAVLFWVSFWFLNKMESKKWVEFIKSKVGKATTTGSVMIFILISFFTVFREGIETVIFYQSLFSFTTHFDIYITIGFLLGMAVVLTIGILIKKIMKKLPLRAIFGLTMGIGAFMSVAFIGNAIRSFQEAGYMPTTALVDTIPIFDSNIASMTGIHPTLESLFGQIVLVSIYSLGLTYMILVKSKERKINSSRLQNK
jgi:high-affinity iron transporter